MLEHGDDVFADGALAMVQQPLVDALAVVKVQTRQRPHFIVRDKIRKAHGAAARATQEGVVTHFVCS